MGCWRSARVTRYGWKEHGDSGGDRRKSKALKRLALKKGKIHDKQNKTATKRGLECLWLRATQTRKRKYKDRAAGKQKIFKIGACRTA